MTTPSTMNRRHFLEVGLGSVILPFLTTFPHHSLASGIASAPSRFRGFNLVEKAMVSRNLPFAEQDFEIIREWEFNFVRLPLDYRCWTEAPGRYREDILREIDQAVAFGRNYGVHVNLAFEIAPGFCHCTTEPESLWAGDAAGHEALSEFVAQWRMLTERYRGFAPSELSFNLLGEPHNITAATYRPIIKAALSTIRDLDFNRPIMVDGLQWATEPVAELMDLNVIQCTRGYLPHELTRYDANWISGANKWPLPTWPLVVDGVLWDKEQLRRVTIEPWLRQIQNRNGKVHVGEWGVFKHTPESAALAWMKDQLALWQEVGWGWALWQLRGPFGVLDSERKDVQYELYKGHNLHRRMLELLRAS
jgi:endoglucanase